MVVDDGGGSERQRGEDAAAGNRDVNDEKDPGQEIERGRLAGFRQNPGLRSVTRAPGSSGLGALLLFQHLFERLVAMASASFGLAHHRDIRENRAEGS